MTYEYRLFDNDKYQQSSVHFASLPEAIAYVRENPQWYDNYVTVERQPYVAIGKWQIIDRVVKLMVF